MTHTHTGEAERPTNSGKKEQCRNRGVSGQEGGKEVEDNSQEEENELEPEEDSNVSALSEGTVVWAKIAGLCVCVCVCLCDPWWPAVVFPMYVITIFIYRC